MKGLSAPGVGAPAVADPEELDAVAAEPQDDAGDVAVDSETSAALSRRRVDMLRQVALQKNQYHKLMLSAKRACAGMPRLLEQASVTASDACSELSRRLRAPANSEEEHEDAAEDAAEEQARYPPSAPPPPPAPDVCKQAKSILIHRSTSTEPVEEVSRQHRPVGVRFAESAVLYQEVEEVLSPVGSSEVGAVACLESHAARSAGALSDGDGDSSSNVSTLCLATGGAGGVASSSRRHSETSLKFERIHVRTKEEDSDQEQGGAGSHARLAARAARRQQGLGLGLDSSDEELLGSVRFFRDEDVYFGEGLGGLGDEDDARDDASTSAICLLEADLRRGSAGSEQGEELAGCEALSQPPPHAAEERVHIHRLPLTATSDPFAVSRGSRSPSRILDMSATIVGVIAASDTPPTPPRGSPRESRPGSAAGDDQDVPDEAAVVVPAEDAKDPTGGAVADVHDALEAGPEEHEQAEPGSETVDVEQDSVQATASAAAAAAAAVRSAAAAVWVVGAAAGLAAGTAAGAAAGLAAALAAGAANPPQANPSPGAEAELKAPAFLVQKSAEEEEECGCADGSAAAGEASSCDGAVSLPPAPPPDDPEPCWDRDEAAAWLEEDIATAEAERLRAAVGNDVFCVDSSCGFLLRSTSDEDDDDDEGESERIDSLPLVACASLIALRGDSRPRLHAEPPPESEPESEPDVRVVRLQVGPLSHRRPQPHTPTPADDDQPPPPQEGAAPLAGRRSPSPAGPPPAARSSVSVQTSDWSAGPLAYGSFGPLTGPEQGEGKHLTARERALALLREVDSRLNAIFCARPDPSAEALFPRPAGPDVPAAAAAETQTQESGPGPPRGSASAPLHRAGRLVCRLAAARSRRPALGLASSTTAALVPRAGASEHRGRGPAVAAGAVHKLRPEPSGNLAEQGRRLGRSRSRGRPGGGGGGGGGRGGEHHIERSRSPSTDRSEERRPRGSWGARGTHKDDGAGPCKSVATTRASKPRLGPGAAGAVAAGVGLGPAGGAGGGAAPGPGASRWARCRTRPSTRLSRSGSGAGSQTGPGARPLPAFGTFGYVQPHHQTTSLQNTIHATQVALGEARRRSPCPVRHALSAHPSQMETLFDPADVARLRPSFPGAAPDRAPTSSYRAAVLESLKDAVQARDPAPLSNLEYRRSSTVLLADGGGAGRPSPANSLVNVIASILEVEAHAADHPIPVAGTRAEHRLGAARSAAGTTATSPEAITPVSAFQSAPLVSPPTLVGSGHGPGLRPRPSGTVGWPPSSQQVPASTTASACTSAATTAHSTRTRPPRCISDSLTVRRPSARVQRGVAAAVTGAKRPRASPRSPRPQAAKVPREPARPRRSLFNPSRPTPAAAPGGPSCARATMDANSGIKIASTMRTIKPVVKTAVQIAHLTARLRLRHNVSPRRLGPAPAASTPEPTPRAEPLGLPPPALRQSQRARSGSQIASGRGQNDSAARR